MTKHLTKEISSDAKEFKALGLDEYKHHATFENGKLIDLRGDVERKITWTKKSTVYSIQRTWKDKIKGGKVIGRELKVTKSYMHPILTVIEKELDPKLVAFAQSKGFDTV